MTKSKMATFMLASFFLFTNVSSSRVADVTVHKQEECVFRGFESFYKDLKNRRAVVEKKSDIIQHLLALGEIYVEGTFDRGNKLSSGRPLSELYSDCNPVVQEQIASGASEIYGSEPFIMEPPESKKEFFIDYKKAVQVFREAEALGSNEAKLYLSQMYWRGQGVPKSYERAIELSTQAAQNNLPDAQFTVGLMWGGHSLKWIGSFKEVASPHVNFRNAYMWISIANANGHKTAAEFMKDLEKKMTAEDIWIAQRNALQCYERFLLLCGID